MIGASETARHLRAYGLPILTMGERPDVPGAVIRPLVEPVPVYPWAMVHRRDARHPALAALRSAANEISGSYGWEKMVDDPWLPSTEGRRQVPGTDVSRFRY